MFGSFYVLKGICIGKVIWLYYQIAIEVKILLLLLLEL